MSGLPGSSAVSESATQFLPIAVDSLDFSTLEMNVYLRAATETEPALYMAAGTEFTRKDHQRLREQGINQLHIAVAQHGGYRKMLSQRLEAIVRDPALKHQQRWKAVRGVCEQMNKDVLLLPGQAEAVESIVELGRAFAEWSRDDASAVHYLLDMSGRDFQTTGHMVNVGVGCGLLAKELLPGDAAMMAVFVQGGMLHDIGKRAIPVSILNKEGKLDPDEWAEFHKHPRLGYEELVRHASLPPLVSLMARDHHERIDGKGYCQGLDGEAISLAARVCAVVDVYDGITASRVHRGPIAPVDAIAMLREGRGTHFDSRVLDAWIAIVERLVKEDPERAVKKSAPGALRSLDSVVSRSFASLTGPAAPAGIAQAAVNGNRRRHDRIAYSKSLTMAFVRQGKYLPIPVGHPFQAMSVDLSRGGVAIQTQWPLSLSDILWIQFPSKDGAAVKRYAKVCRVRRNGKLWIAGCTFIEQDDLPR